MGLMPDSLEWDHNRHYHRWVLDQLTDRPESVLDIGCGAGRLAARLAERAAHVDALDPSEDMIEVASKRGYAGDINWVNADFLDPAAEVAESYDVITSVASLHHMPLRPALTKMAALVRPGGQLLIVGLSRPSSISDWIYALAGVPTNVIHGAALARRGLGGKPDEPGMPVKWPPEPMDDIRSAADDLLPGHTLERGVYFRYLLRWSPTQKKAA